jgi:hypothetical protein
MLGRGVRPSTNKFKARRRVAKEEPEVTPSCTGEEETDDSTVHVIPKGHESLRSRSQDRDKKGKQSDRPQDAGDAAEYGGGFGENRLDKLAQEANEEQS